MSKLGSRGRIALGTSLLLACALPTLAAGHRAESDKAALQVLADVTLIDRQCREVAVDFGRLFRYGEQHGFRMIEIMPLGAKRAQFEAAMRRRTQASSDAELCSAVAEQDNAAVPGVLAPR